MRREMRRKPMRGQLPIVIAFVIVLAIIISTTYYVSTIPVHLRTSLYGRSYSKWSILSSELDSLLHLMLSTASRQAHSVMYQYIADNYNEYVYYVPYKIRVDNNPLEFYYWWFIFPIWLDYYGYINFTTGYSIEYDLDKTMNEYISLLSSASRTATSVFNDTAYTILENWIKWMEKAGYTVGVLGFNTSYVSSLSFSGLTSEGKADASIKFIVKIIDSSGDYMVYNKSISAHLILNFTRGYTEGEGWILPVTVQSYIIVNGQKYYYMLPPRQLTLYLSSFIFRTLPSFSNIYGSSRWIRVEPATVFYRGQGVENVTYIIRYTSYTSYIDDMVERLAMTRIYNITIPNNMTAMESVMVGIDVNNSYPYTYGILGLSSSDTVYYDASSLDPNYEVVYWSSYYYLYPDNIAYQPTAKYYIAGLMNVKVGDAVLTAPLQAIFALNFTLYNTWYIGFGWSTDLTGN